MERTELARARAETLAKRPAEVIRAEPVTLTAVRAMPRPLVHRRTFGEWRRDHYVADQAMRVVAILLGMFALAALAGVLLLWFIGSVVNGASLKAGGAVVALLVVAYLIVSLAKRREHSGYGYHWTKCK